MKKYTLYAFWGLMTASMSFIYPIFILAQNTPKVLVYTVSEQLDTKAVRFLESALKEAQTQKVKLFVIESNLHLETSTLWFALQEKIKSLNSTFDVVGIGTFSQKIVEIRNQYTSLDIALEKENLTNAQIIRFEPTFWERFLAIFLHPFWSGLLLLMLIGGVFFEIKTPGFGFPVLIGLLALCLFVGINFYFGLVETWELGVFLVGFMLFCLEIFVLPGFGIAGILGLIGMFGSLFLMMVHNKSLDFSMVSQAEVINSLSVMSAAMIGSVMLFWAVVPRILQSKYFQKISLNQSMNRAEGYTSNTYTKKMIGKTGLAQTVLRPSGKVLIDGVIYDASTTGEFAEKDSPIIVISQEGTSLKVKINP